MKKEIFFSYNNDLPSSHPDLFHTENFVGVAIATDNGEELEIEVVELYVCPTPMANVTPLAYTPVDAVNVEFRKGAVYEAIEADIADRFDTDENNAFAESVVTYYEARKRVAAGFGGPISVTIHEAIQAG